MPTNWNDPADIMRRRQQAISAGYKAQDVDEFIVKKKQESATLELGRQGKLSEEEVIKLDPTVRLKMEKEGIDFAKSKKERDLQLKKDEEFSKVGNFIQVMLDEYQNIPAGQKGTGIGSITKRLGFLTPEAAQYEKGLSGFAGAVKQLVGEAGMLTNYDIQRIVDVFPRVTDTTAQAEISKQRLNEIFEKRYGQSLISEELQQDPKQTQSSLPQALGNALYGLGKTVAEPFVTTGRNVATAAVTLPQAGLVEMLSKINPQLAGQIASKDIFGTQKELERQTPEERFKEQLGASTEIGLMAATPTLGKFLGKGVGKFSSLFKGSPPKITQADLLKGLNLAEKGGTTRTALIKTAQEEGKKVSGSNIIKSIEEWAVRAKRANPTEVKRINTFLSSATKSFKGKDITAQTAKNLWDDAMEGFSAAGTKGSSLEAGYHRTIRDVLRKELDRVAPGFEKSTKTIKEGLDLEKILKSVRTGTQRSELREGLKETPAPLREFLKKYSVPAIGGGLSYFALSKLLGRGGQQQR